MINAITNIIRCTTSTIRSHKCIYLPLSSCRSLRFAISTLQFIFVHMFAIALCVLIMCLHPTVDRKLSTLYDKYENASLDKFDNCDYVHSITDVKCTDLVIMQLNIRGIGLKKS